MFLWTAFPAKQMWDLTVFPYLQFFQQVLYSVFSWFHKKPFIWGQPLLTSTPMGDLGWMRLLSICISFSHCCFREVNLDSHAEVLSVTGKVPESSVSFGVLSTMEPQERPGYCKTLTWSLTPFMVAKTHFLNSMFGQKFNKMVLTKTSFYLVNL